MSAEGPVGEGPDDSTPESMVEDDLWADDDPTSPPQASPPARQEGPPDARLTQAPTEVPATTSAPTAAASEEEEEEPGTEPVAHNRTLRSAGSFFRELPGLLLLAFILALLIKSFLIQAFYIPSGSMEHTLDIGDRVLVNKVVYHIHPPRRGDVIVFGDPHPVIQAHRNPVSALAHWLTDGLGISTDPNKDFIKRVIGLPGETVEVNRGVVYIDGKALDEHYFGPAPSTGDFGPLKVPKDTLFVMGDNRGDSDDSRGSLGPVPMDKVIGRAFVVIWPPSRIAILRRPHYTIVSNSSASASLSLALAGLVLSRRRKTGRGSRRAA